MLITASSFFPHIRYVSFYSYTGILRPLYAVAWISIVAFAVICFAAIYLSYIIGLKNIQPFNRLLRQIDIDPFTEDDAVQAISQKTDALLHAQQSRLTKLQSQQDILNGLFLADYIENPCTTEMEAFEKAQRYDVLFDFPFFTVCVITLNGTDTSDLSQQLLYFFRTRHFDTVITAAENRCTLLFNHEKFAAPQFFSPLMKEVNDAHFTGIALIGIGLCYDNLLAVPQSYKEALWAITDPKRQEGRQIVCYSQWKGTDIHGCSEFQEALYAHDYTAAEAYLAVLFAEPHLEAWLLSKLEYVFSPVIRILKEYAATVHAGAKGIEGGAQDLCGDISFTAADQIQK